MENVNNEAVSGLSEERKAIYNKRKAQKKRKKIILHTIYYVVGAILSLIFLFPLIYMLAASTKTEAQNAFDAGTIYMFIPNFDFTQTFKNYATLFVTHSVWKYVINSLAYAAITIVLNILINGLAGYAIAKFRFPGKKFFNFIIIFLIVVPVETSIIPLYAIVKSLLGLKEASSVLAVILPASISIFNIFLFIQFFSGIPTEFEEAARMDGATDLEVFFKIIVPLSKPIIATVAVFCFIGVWNDYLWPIMVLPQAEGNAWPLLPIQAALQSIQAIPGITTGEIMASLVTTSLPIFIVYIVAQKYIVQGFGSAGLKL